jgi:hypothetical protein
VSEVVQSRGQVRYPICVHKNLIDDASENGFWWCEPVTTMIKPVIEL